MAANKTRPMVTIPQKIASAIDACVAVAPTRVVMSSWDQLPFIVSQMPYKTANAANNQNLVGTPGVARCFALAAGGPARSGSRALNSNTTASSAADRTG